MGGPSSGSSSSSDGDATATGAVGVLPPFGAPGTPRSSRRGNSSSASAAGSVGTMPLKRPLSAGRAAVEPGLAAAPRLPPPAKLAYSIHSYSSHAASYHPRNILVNKPGDQSSRWSSASNNHNQFVLLRLDRPAIVQSIVFGKFHKAHVCNLKEFKIFGGMSPDSLTELLHAGLRNDPEMETFPLKHKNGDIMFPIQYIKIQPLVSHGGSFNFAIWYLELRGVKDADIVRGTNERWVNHRESHLYRLILKHLRQRNLSQAFSALQLSTSLSLEHPLLSELHHKLVVDGEFEEAEAIVVKAAEEGRFEGWIAASGYEPVWRRIWPPGDTPCQRGGHQLVVDTARSQVYLHGGYDGHKDLADLWLYDIPTARWTCLCKDTEAVGGPTARAVHKMVFDEGTRCLYLLGRYVEVDSSRGERIAALEPDFWRYWCERDEWELISADTKSEGGPELIHDHQMVIDADNQTLYVFGGKVQNASLTGDLRYSGLYSYDISTNHWNLMLDDDSQDGPVQLKSRSGHSMLFDPQSREIYIFAGQRQKECLADVFAYDVDSGLVHEVARDFTKLGGPEPGFTDRSTIDPQLGEIYVMSGLLKEKNASEEMVKSCFWVYNFRRDLWTKVYQNDQESENKGDWARPGETEPAPRYAHQMVYDPVRKCQMLFGGNPGDPVNPRARLDDFWELWLFRPTLDDIVRRCRFYIRRQHFRELCAAKDQARALRFLQTNMNEVVNHANEDEAKEFRELTGLLFSPGVEGAGGMVGGKGRKKEVIREPPTETHRERTELYEKLLEFFPEDMKEPAGHLLDLLP